MNLNQDSVEDNKKDDERSALRLNALEFMISLSEAGLNTVRKVTGWTDIMVCACLEGMGEFDEDKTEMSGLEAWLREDVSNFFWFLYFCALVDAGGCSLLLTRVRLKQIPLRLCTNNN